jgi:hypothetical protein
LSDKNKFSELTTCTKPSDDSKIEGQLPVNVEDKTPSKSENDASLNKKSNAKNFIYVPSLPAIGEKSDSSADVLVNKQSLSETYFDKQEDTTDCLLNENICPDVSIELVDTGLGGMIVNDENTDFNPFDNNKNNNLSKESLQDCELLIDVKHFQTQGKSSDQTQGSNNEQVTSRGNNCSCALESYEIKDSSQHNSLTDKEVII